VYKNSLLRKFSGPKRGKTKGAGENRIKKPSLFELITRCQGNQIKVGDMKGLAILVAAENDETFCVLIILNAVTQVTT
jgi:hypothetical protein